MKAYQNFKVATYIYAYDLEKMNDEEIQEGIDRFKSKIHLDKIYIENHRGVCDISVKRLQEVKELFQKNGIITAGGITYTQLVKGIRKPAYFDTYCYTDPMHREDNLRVAKELASIFDEIILDDFFFTACRCEMCIRAKGKMSWKEYRLKLMEDYAKVLVSEVKKVNPRVKFVVKYPNWYESYQECGFNPEKQKDVFDGIFTGTETRNTYSAQHLQRYESYSIMRLMENISPGRNGGGWIDMYGSFDNMTYVLEQAEATLMGKAKEIMLWNFSLFNNTYALPSLGLYLYKVDSQISMQGNPTGVKVWEPYNGDGEDQVYNYLGMCGISLEPSPYFDEKAPAILFTEATAEAPDSLEKLEAYVRNGGNAVVTVGYFRKMIDAGITDLTSVRLTNRHVLGNNFMIHNANYFMSRETAFSTKDIMFEVLNYKTNATHSDITLMVDEDNFPIMTEDNYGKGRFFILNVPENFADLYKLPLEVIRAINKHISFGHKAYLGCAPKYSMYTFDNGVYTIHSYAAYSQTVQLVVRGKVNRIYNMETDAEYTNKIDLPRPSCMGDCTSVYEEPEETAYLIPMSPGETIMVKID